MNSNLEFDLLDNTTEVALRDLLDSELLLIGGGDVIQFGG